MVQHDDRTYLDDEGLEYGKTPSPREESESAEPKHLGSEGRLWGAHDAYGGYDAE